MKISDMEDEEYEKIDEEDSRIQDLLTEAKICEGQLKALQSIREKEMNESMRKTPDLRLEKELAKIVSKLADLQVEDRKASARPVEHTVKLPKLELPYFDGNLLAWREFFDAFESAIDSNPSLSDIQKHQYLRSKLKGDAKSLLSGLSVNAENYYYYYNHDGLEPIRYNNCAVALKLLLDRFGNKQKVIDAHYLALMDMPPAKGAIVKIRATYDILNKHLRSLEALEQDANQEIFVSLILSKLPSDIHERLEVGKDCDDPWTVKSLMSSLDRCIHAKEQAQNPRLVSRQATSVSSISEAFAAVDNRQRFTPKCHFCQQYHWSDECKSYSTIEARKGQIKGACFVCLKQGHRVKDCKVKPMCYHCKQTGKHHRSLCPTKFKDTTSTGGTALVALDETVMMQTALTSVSNPSTHASTVARLFFDSGSQRSYISSDLAQRLHLRASKQEVISLATFGSNTPRTISSKLAKISVKLLDGGYTYMTTNIIPSITGPIQRVGVDSVKLQSWAHCFSQLPLADPIPEHSEPCKIDMLLGNDYYLDIVKLERHEVQPGLFIMSSKLGWILSGRVPIAQPTFPSLSLLSYSTPAMACINVHCQSDTNMHDGNLCVRDFWSLETIGIRDNPVDSDDEKAQQLFDKSVTHVDGRYQVQFPWKQFPPPLPSNYKLAYGRLRSTWTRLGSSSELLDKYDAVIQQQLATGIIEKVAVDTDSDNPVHYIPHHAVITPAKTTTKIRIVYDASAKTSTHNPSLNDCMLRGPVILEDLAGLLLRFRSHPIAIVADIEKAFHQVSLCPRDRDVTRFLWLKDPRQPVSRQNIQVYRFCRVPFGAIASPFLLAATVSYHLSHSSSTFARTILGDMYVDNIITGVQTITEAKLFYEEAKSLFMTASMNLREWASNDCELEAFIPDKDRATSHLGVLGMAWDSHDDVLRLSSLNDDLLRSSTTKRQVLRSVSSLFDPLGLVSPAVLKAKLFIQGLWQDKVEWDDTLPPERLTEWKPLVEDLLSSSKFHVRRRFCTHAVRDTCYQLHGFCDASRFAYGTAVYIRSCSEGYTESEVQLIFSKTRLSPVTPVSIPRLELLAAVIGTRALQYVQKHLHLNIESCHLWSDSKCVLHWIRSQRVLSLFVHNRVKEIRQCSNIHFRYINTAQNPADIASRGMSFSELLNNHSWWEGPSWLKLHANEWPLFDFNVTTPEILEAINSECKDRSILFETGLLSGMPFVPAPFGIDSTRFSSLQKLLKVTFFCQKFVSLVLHRTPPTDLVTARQQWERYVQQKHFRSVGNSSIAKSLGLKTDSDDILRCHGRLQNADIPYDAQFPKLLPKRDHFTDLVVLDCHIRLLHAGVTHTLSQLRYTYWIPQGRSTVARVLRQCLLCRKHLTGPYVMPRMPPLPRERVSESPPFTYTGLDYLGPLTVIVDGQHTKVWICLFTCMAVRAVSLEVVTEMSAYQFLLCLSRFIAQRGRPAGIISDNAAQFNPLCPDCTTIDPRGSIDSSACFFWRTSVFCRNWHINRKLVVSSPR